MADDNRLHRAYVGLGTNMGDREDNLLRAVQLLGECPGTRVAKTSSLYETEPVGYLEQPAFLNMAVALDTSLSADDIFKCLLEIERQLGRVRDIRWGPRTIDLDLLLYDKISMNTERLILPHPRMLERAFVLVPLLEVAGRDEIPGIDPAYSTEQAGKEGVIRWKNTL